mmetsp:Transcript_24403/g.53257  ORF Transcript_24403/g.53257 Transcript_24403/m.53257 type:complete len:85 (+) Transcript_24403:1224-1478(+)
MATLFLLTHTRITLPVPPILKKRILTKPQLPVLMRLPSFTDRQLQILVSASRTLPRMFHFLLAPTRRALMLPSSQDPPPRATSK